MKKYLYAFLNDAMVVLICIVATKLTEQNLTLGGIIAWIIAFICLDFHSYIDKKLNYPNNIFIKS